MTTIYFIQRPVKTIAYVTFYLLPSLPIIMHYDKLVTASHLNMFCLSYIRRHFINMMIFSNCYLTVLLFCASLHIFVSVAFQFVFILYHAFFIYIIIIIIIIIIITFPVMRRQYHLLYSTVVVLTFTLFARVNVGVFMKISCKD